MPMMEWPGTRKARKEVYGCGETGHGKDLK